MHDVGLRVIGLGLISFSLNPRACEAWGTVVPLHTGDKLAAIVNQHRALVTEDLVSIDASKDAGCTNAHDFLIVHFEIREAVHVINIRSPQWP